jgi:hypothetical protein
MYTQKIFDYVKRSRVPPAKFLAVFDSVSKADTVITELPLDEHAHISTVPFIRSLVFPASSSSLIA